MPTHILFITCIDGRLFDAYGTFMSEQNYDSYYQCTLAGSSLGCMGDNCTLSCGYQYISTHLTTVKQLAPINKIIIADHKDCGAYRLSDESDDISNHTKHIKCVANALRGMDAFADDMTIEGVLFSLDGTWVKVI